MHVSWIFLFVFVSTILRLNHGQSTCEQLPLASANCFFPLGGGETTLALPQMHMFSPTCLSLFAEYFHPDGQYWIDTEAAIDAARQVLEMDGNYSQMVVLDVDETAVTNVAAFQDPSFVPDIAALAVLFGSFESINATAIPATLAFYQELREKGFSVVFISGRRESDRQAMEQTLEAEGYGTQCAENPAAAGSICYFQLVVREDGDDRDVTVFKSAERAKLKEMGFEIIASIGDQWSDLLGTDRAETLIKMPNPVYYVP